MTADVTRDRRVTVTQPWLITVLVDGSRLCWALPSLVHEGLGYRAFEPDRIQGDAVSLHACITAQSRDHVLPLIARRFVPTRKPRAGLAAVKAWPGDDRACGSRTATASLDGGCTRALPQDHGRDEETAQSNKETDQGDRCHAVGSEPHLLPLDFRAPIQGWVSGGPCAHLGHAPRSAA